MAVELVTICTYSNGSLAEAARLGLEIEGVRAYINDNNIIAADWLWGNAVGGVKLEVHEDDVEAALRYFRKYPNMARPATDLNVEVNNDQSCLACGEAMAEDQERCSKCGWSFLDDAAE